MRTKIEDKAVALAGRGRVRITARTADVTVAVVSGEHGEYQVTIDPEGSRCSCEHGRWRGDHAECSHVLATEIEKVRGSR